MSSQIEIEDVVCPRCKTTRYRNPSLKLMVNTCGHSLCESCVGLLFARGSGQCPQCNVMLRRTNFKFQRFDDATVEKEMDIRKKVLSEFNKREEDFHDLDEYNDYLEQIEVLIFNLYNEIDVDIVKKFMEKNKKENQEIIKKNRVKLSKEAYELEEIIRREEISLKLRNQANLNSQITNDKEKVHLKQRLLDDLAFSEQSANQILNNHAMMKEQQVKMLKERREESEQEILLKYSSGVAMGMRVDDEYSYDYQQTEGEEYIYKEAVFESLGPTAPSREMLLTDGHMNVMPSSQEIELSGGYHPVIYCHRIIQEAYGSLFFDYDEVFNA